MFSLFRKGGDGSAGDLGQDVALAQDQQVLAVDHDLRAAVLRVQDLVALGDVERDALAVVVELAVADRQDLALLRLLLGSVRKDDAGSSRRVLLDSLDDQAIAQGLEIHRVTSTQFVRGPNLWHSRQVSASGRS